jgi:Leucine-rich repeat (LRR) protein
MKAILTDNTVLEFDTFDELFINEFITQIQYLECDNMKITDLPNDIIKITNLRFLSLNNNLLSYLPKLPNGIKYLYLNFNHFKDIPKEITDLANLEILLLYSNKLISFTSDISHLQKLKTLGLSYNNLHQLPKEIGNLKKLKYLEIKENNLYSLPKTLVDMTNLRVLTLSNNKISRLPKKMDKLEKLEKIDIDNNNLCFLPKELFTLNHLIGISVNFNKLHNLPKIFKKSSLKYICCIYNNITENYDDDRLILNAKELSKIDSILTINKINKSLLKKQTEQNLLEIIKNTMNIHI